nr:MAG TPA: hypothetical protein [Caudoviricetes sp.]
MLCSAMPAPLMTRAGPLTLRQPRLIVLWFLKPCISMPPVCLRHTPGLMLLCVRQGRCACCRLCCPADECKFPTHTQGGDPGILSFF